MRFTLGKEHKLCGTLAVDRLFSRGAADAPHSALAYPLRAVWIVNERRTHGAPVQFVISVPKRRLRHAVDRVQMRRRIREAYRLNRFTVTAADDNRRVDLAFVYVADTLKPYEPVERAVRRLLDRVQTSLTGAEAGAR